MKKVIFDGDGTLYDSGHGIKVSANYALRKFGYDTYPLDKMDFFVGPPLMDCFRLCKIKEDDLENVVACYQKYQAENALFDLVLYDDVSSVLNTIKNRGYQIYLGTSRRQPVGQVLLKHLKIDSYFDFAFGGSEDGKHCKKEEVIKKVLDSTPKCEETFMVGDTSFDMKAGKEFHLKTIACLYGYGDKDEIKRCQPDYLVFKFKDILGILK